MPLMTKSAARQLNALQLAYMGDTIFDLLARTDLMFTDLHVKDMHGKVTEVVNARSQARALQAIRHLLDEETWMNANKAMELGFADGMIQREQNTEAVALDEATGESIVKDEGESRNPEAVLFSRRAVNNALLNKLEKHYSGEKKTVSEQAEIPVTAGCSAEELRERLAAIKRFI